MRFLGQLAATVIGSAAVVVGIHKYKKIQYHIIK